MRGDVEITVTPKMDATAFEDIKKQLVELRDYYPATGEAITVASMIKLIKGVVEEGVAVAVIRCSHCGQWGARFCECRKCGAPIE